MGNGGLWAVWYGSGVALHVSHHVDAVTLSLTGV